MGQISLEDFVGILANILILGTAIGLIFSILIQPRRERANWWFAVFLVMLAGWSFSGIVSSLPELQIFIPPRTGLFLYISCLGLIPVTFFVAAMSFCQISTPLTRGVSLFAIPAVVLALILLWSDQLFIVDFAALPQPVGFHHIIGAMTVAPGGYITLLVGGSFLLVAIVHLRRTPGERSRSLQIPAILMVIGLLSNLFSPLNRLPFDVALTAIAATLIGHTIIRQQLLNPLSQLNAQLTEANQELRLLVTDLTTEQERSAILNDELRTTSRYKTDFLATMSHELRTPLNSVVGYSELLLQGLYGDLNERQEDRIGKILRNGRDLLALINDILDLSKIDAGQMDLALKHLELAGTIETVVAEKRPTIDQKGLTLHAHVPADLPAIYGDQLRIHQILSNLLNNAIKFTLQGDITLTASEVLVRDGLCETVSLPMKGWLKDGRWVVLAVQDTGIGISPEDHARIFDEFRQLDGTTTREYGGTGLGLAITKQLVTMHQGTIWLDSRQNEGSTFYVALPASSKPADNLAEPQPLPGMLPAEAPSSPLQPHVLCIDDNQEALDILMTYLSDAGYRVTQASSGQAGVEMAQALQPDVITTDLMMPGMTGWDVVSQLRNHPETARIPVVIISIVDQQPVGYEPDVAAHIHKPIDRFELLSTLASIVHSQPDELPILLVDDDRYTRDMITTLLTSAGQSVVTCNDGAEALTWLEHHRPSLILLDLLMPGLSGLEVLARVREQPEFASLPVLVITTKELSETETAELERHQARIIHKHGLRKGILLKELEQAIAQP